MRPIGRLIISALTLVLAVVLALIVLGAVLDILRCVIIAAAITLGGTFLYRALSRRNTLPTQQIIDQPRSPSKPPNEPADIARQIEARKERLDK